MPKYVDPDAIEWFRYPALAQDDQSRHWLRCEALLGLSAHTIDAYARGLDAFLEYCQRVALAPLQATRGDIAGFVGVLRQRVKTPAAGAVESYIRTKTLWHIAWSSERIAFPTCQADSCGQIDALIS